MGLLSFLRRDPTRGWPILPPRPLVLDLGRRALNGIALGAPVAALRALGRPGRPPLRDDFVYPAMGLEVAVSRERVRFFSFVFRPRPGESEVEGPDFRPCALELRLPGDRAVTVTTETARETLEAALGPLADESAGGAPLLAHRVPGCWLGFSFDDDGRLLFLDAEPADEG